ncbi:MAG: GNAT family N-acetyltransferase [Acidobacteria bacterium]|nr:GNAT family N-acetyltransferase [Acidobacteriota bacterium]
MSALRSLELASSDMVDLRQVDSAALAPLLEEETQVWKDTLDWDFSRSAELVRRFIELRGLDGYALLREGAVAGYTYSIYEDHKALIGDLYIRARFRSARDENRLLEQALRSLAWVPRISRVESQLMMISAAAGELPFADRLSRFDRGFMMLELEAARLAPRRPRASIGIMPWREAHEPAAAELIAAAYVGHVDSLINDQYRSLPGARQFLSNIVQYPGCGQFFRPGSFTALNAASGRMCGISLASLVAARTGHITQLCVDPAERGAGLGYELLRLSLEALRRAGCRRVSLTVTSSNQEAVRLYEQTGFRTIRTFSACVWEI